MTIIHLLPFRFEQTVSSFNRTESHRHKNGLEQPANHRAAQQTHFYNSDDSEDEIRRLVASQETSHGLLHPEVEEDELEVVGHDYLIKSGQKGNAYFEQVFHIFREFVLFVFLVKNYIFRRIYCRQ